MRFRFRLVSPRAAAHVWGKGARILTEINRLTQLNPPASGEIAALPAGNLHSPASEEPGWWSAIFHQPLCLFRRA